MKNPINYSFKTEIWPFLMLLSAVVLSFWAYPLLPDTVVSHWDFSGQANGWSSREFHCLFFPTLIFFIYFVLSLSPKFDPNSERYQEFANYFLIIRDAVILVLLVVFAAATFSNLGYPVNIAGVAAGAIGLLMIVIGNYLGKLKRNFFIGIKTAWTLSSENVWNKTHRLASRLFIIWGLGLIVAPWVGSILGFIILFGGIILVFISPAIYSYWLFDKEKKEKDNLK